MFGADAELAVLAEQSGDALAVEHDVLAVEGEGGGFRGFHGGKFGNGRCNRRCGFRSYGLNRESGNSFQLCQIVGSERVGVELASRVGIPRIADLRVRLVDFFGRLKDAALENNSEMIQMGRGDEIPWPCGHEADGGGYSKDDFHDSEKGKNRGLLTAPGSVGLDDRRQDDSWTLDRGGQQHCGRQDQSLRAGLEQSGMTSEAALQTIEFMINGQSVMLATNQIMLVMGISFVFAASVIWLAPKPTRSVDPAAGGH